jgi:hypothetical protein
VRATGGNNASRTLVVQTYNTNVQHGLNFFTLPTDTIASRLIVEVHNYDPYDFTINPTVPATSGARRTRLRQQLQLGLRVVLRRHLRAGASKWVDQGVPVILGEYGVETRPARASRRAPTGTSTSIAPRR